MAEDHEKGRKDLTETVMGIKDDGDRGQLTRTDNGRRSGLGMRKSWSTDSLVSHATSFAKTCVCSPTKHQGSFRCRLHRHQLDGQQPVTDRPSIPKRFSLLSLQEVDENK